MVNDRWLESAGVEKSKMIGADITGVSWGTGDFVRSLLTRARAGEAVRFPGHKQVISGVETYWEYSLSSIKLSDGIGLLIIASDVTAASRTAENREPAPGLTRDDLSLTEEKTDGQKIYLPVSMSPIRDAQARIVGPSSIARDIAGGKDIESTLREKEMTAVLLNVPLYTAYLIDTNGTVLAANNKMASRYGRNPVEVMGRNINQIMPQEAVVRVMRHARKAIETRKPASYEIEREGRFVVMTIYPIADDDGKTSRLAVYGHDLTERKRAEEQLIESLREKEIMLKEIHHRVKNNMQIISSLINLQSEHIDERHLRDIFKASQSRIRSMALIHEKLYQSHDLAIIDFRKYLDSLVSYLMQFYEIDPGKIRITVRVEEILLGIDMAVPCGLIVNELITNSMKHAFPGDRKGEIKIEVLQESEYYVLRVSDNGKGIESCGNINCTRTLGLQLVHDLTEQIEGTLDLSVSNGTSFTIKLPPDRSVPENTMLAS